MEYPYGEDIAVSKLRLDLKNWRLPDVQDNQLEAYAMMAIVQRDKLIALAQHIVRHGINPNQRFIVIPDEEDRFIVLDGNRRLTALRALEDPDKILG